MGRRLTVLAAIFLAVSGGSSSSIADGSHPAVEGHLKRADAYFDAQDLQGALREYNAAIAIAGPTERLLALRGGVKFEIGDYQGAATDLTSAIRSNPKNPDFYLLRGLSRSLLKPPDRKGTCDDLEKARALGVDIRDIAKGVDEWCVVPQE